ncbi:MAG TPA: caspase family protein, partial [Candidatus Obscuribacterales bacterium]
MTLGRREFLQRLSAALTALGMTDLSLTGYANTYQRALAEGTRCLALLIGINEYAPATWQSAPALDKGWALAGAVTDVELQQELLINRFGVRAADMVTLTDEQATGAGILAAVQGHLLAQAQPGDTVMLHFSGLGSRVQVAGQPQRLALPTLVAADSGLPTAIAPTLQD